MLGHSLAPRCLDPSFVQEVFSGVCISPKGVKVMISDEAASYLTLLLDGRCCQYLYFVLLLHCLTMHYYPMWSWHSWLVIFKIIELTYVIQYSGYIHFSYSSLLICGFISRSAFGLMQSSPSCSTDMSPPKLSWNIYFYNIIMSINVSIAHADLPVLLCLGECLGF